MSSLTRSGWKNAHKFFDQERLGRLQAQYSLDDLRALLAGKRWSDLVNDSVIYGSSPATMDGVHFTVRIGQFLGRGAVAVYALNKIIAMHYILDQKIYPCFLTTSSALSADNHSGFVLLPGDFSNGRLGTLKLTDLIIQGDESDQPELEQGACGVAGLEQA